MRARCPSRRTDPISRGSICSWTVAAGKWLGCTKAPVHSAKRQIPLNGERHAARAENKEASQKNRSIRRAKHKQPAGKGNDAGQRIKPHPKRQADVAPRRMQEMESDN